MTATEETIARLLLYRFLGQAFAYPDVALSDILADGEAWVQLLAADEALELKATPILVDLQAWLAEYEDDEERLLLDLQVEHTYLFITARPHVPAPPYESAYTGRGFLMGEPVSQVLEAYREAGLAMHRDYDALPDHVAAELEFVSYLVQQETEAGESGEWCDRQHRFLEEHLLRWGTTFLEKVAAGARKPFYRLLADLAGTFFSAEAQRFAMTIPSRVGIEEENHG